MKLISFLIGIIALFYTSNLVAQSTPMAGNYTINPVGGDFTSFNDAIDSLNARGVSAPVIISAASGIYNESIVLTPISGASVTNTITFTSATGINTDVTLQDTVSSTKNYVISMSGADFIQFRNMTIQTCNVSSFYGRVIYMHNKCSGNVFDNDRIIGVHFDNASTDAMVVHIDAGANMNNIFSNNEILNGSQGIFLEGNYVPYRSGGSKIINNKIKNWTCQGINLIYNDSITITGNEISNNPDGISGTVGIKCDWISSNCLLAYNTINCRSNYISIGITLRSNVGSSDSVFNQVYNNMISVVGTGDNYGLFLSECRKTKIFFNSVNLMNGSANSYSLYSIIGSIGVSIFNNTFSNFGSGYAFYLSSGIIDTVDFNNYYSTGSYVIHWGSNYSSLSQFQAVSTFDSSSVSFDPMFVSDTNLHIQQANLFFAGKTVDYIDSDIDGDLRNSPPTIGADEYEPLDYDIALINFDQPQTSISGSSGTISVRMRNFSNNILSTVLIGWSMNDVVQPSVLWTGSLLPGAVADSVMLFSGTFLTGAYHMKAWVELVNGTGDMNQINDTIEYSFTVCNSPLHGNYFIGTGRQFRFFNDAVSVLESCGIDGAVVFQVDSGTYNEKISIDPIQGSSPINTITFESASGIKSDVILQDSNTGVSDDYVVQLKDADYFIFRNLTLRLIPSWFVRVVSVETGSNNNVFDNNMIISAPGTGFSSQNSAVSVFGNNNNTISNNEIYSGCCGVYCSNGFKNTIYNNKISEWSDLGIFSETNDSLYILDNEVTDTTVSYGTGIRSINNYGGCVFSGNKILLYNGIESHNYGFYFYNDSYFVSDTIPILVYNNFVSISPDNLGSTGYYYGFYLQNMKYLNIYFNSVSIAYVLSTATYALYETNAGGHINIKNNVFTNWGYGYAYYISTPNKITTSDFNDYYSPIDNLIYWNGNYSSVSSLSANSGKDNSSVSVDPLFNSPINLHSHQSFLYGAGNDVPGIDTDIDSDPRNSPPSIGADEIVVPDYDCGITAILLPADTVLVQNPQIITLRIKNFGTETLTSIPVAFVSDLTQIPIIETWSGVLLSGQTVDFTFSSTITPNTGNTNINSCAYTLLSSDTIYNNDSTCKTVFVSDIVDCGIEEVLSPASVVVNYTIQQVTVVIRNYGTNILTLIPVTYSLGTPNPTITHIWTGNLLPNDTIHFSFSGDPVLVSYSDSFNLCTYTSLIGDQNLSNDTICMSVLIDKINEPELDNDMSVFPNPADKYVVLKFMSQSTGKGIVSVSSLDGRIVQNTEVYINNGENQIRMKTGELQSGVYYITILKKEICFGNAILVIE